MLKNACILVALIVAFQFALAVQAAAEGPNKPVRKNLFDLTTPDMKEFKSAVTKFLLFEMIRDAKRKTLAKVPEDILHLRLYNKRYE